jgi:hypothetical protein
VGGDLAVPALLLRFVAARAAERQRQPCPDGKGPDPAEITRVQDAEGGALNGPVQVAVPVQGAYTAGETVYFFQKMTLPVGLLPVTVAVKVTLAPTVDGLG